MKNYTPGEVGTAIGVSSSSIRNWTEQEELQPYLSDMAVRRNDHEHAKQREYTIEDLYVLNTIAKAKTRHNSWQDVADFLEDGNLYKDLPASAALVMQETAAEGFADKIMLHQRIEFLETALREREIEVEELRNELQQRVDEVRNEERKAARSERTEFQTTINDLNRLIGKLEAQIEILKENKDEK